MTAARDEKCKAAKQFKNQIADLASSRNKQITGVVNNYFAAEKQYEGVA